MAIKDTDSLRRIGFTQWFNARVLRDGSRNDFMGATGYSKGRVTQLLDESKPFGEDAASRIEDAYQLGSGYFLDLGRKIEQGDWAGFGTITLSGDGLPEEVPDKKAGLPLLSWGQAHLMTLENTAEPLIACEQIATYEAPRGPRTKLVRMPDDSLGPRILRGDLLEFDPDLAPTSGRIVLLRSPAGTFAIRRFDALFVEQNNLTVIASCERWHAEEP